MAEQLDRKGYPVSPRKLGDSAWFYEEPKGILVVQQFKGCAAQVVVPWRQLEAAVDRHRALKRKSAK